MHVYKSKPKLLARRNRMKIFICISYGLAKYYLCCAEITDRANTYMHMLRSMLLVCSKRKIIEKEYVKIIEGLEACNL